jgi:hypothetical protein
VGDIIDAVNPVVREEGGTGELCVNTDSHKGQGCFLVEVR